MSRSYKHRGFVQDPSSKRFGKRLANKYVRRILEVPSGNTYRKYFNSWDISDYKIDCRGIMEPVERRPGRKFKRIKIDRFKFNPWILTSDDYKDKLWKDWNK